MKVMEFLKNERVLEDDYPVHVGYSYIADKRIVASMVFGTVKDLKKDLNAKEVRNCDLVERDLFEERDATSRGNLMRVIEEELDGGP